MNPAEKKGKRLLARYPILAAVPAEKRPFLVRKAMRHPAVLLLLLILAFVVLPWTLDFLISVMGLTSATQDRVFLLKFWALLIIPSAFVFVLFKFFVLPWSLKLVMTKEGYLHEPTPDSGESGANTGKDSKEH